MKIKANGININYQIDGPDGAPWLVFSNSLATSMAMWDEQAAALKDSYRVLRYDQRGHGGTDAPAGRYPYDTLLADALGLARRPVDQEGAFRRPVHGRRDRARARRAPSRAVRPHHRLRLAVPIDAANRASNGKSASRLRRSRASRRWSSRPSRAGFRPRRGQEPAAPRQGARHDPRHAGQRLHRLRRGAGRPRLRLRRRHA